MVGVGLREVRRTKRKKEPTSVGISWPNGRSQLMSAHTGGTAGIKWVPWSLSMSIVVVVGGGGSHMSCTAVLDPTWWVFVLLNSSGRPFVTSFTCCDTVGNTWPLFHRTYCCSAPFHKWDQKPESAHSLFCHCLRPPPDLSGHTHKPGPGLISLKPVSNCLGLVGLTGYACLT